MQKATQQLNNTSQLRKVRRDIARVRTVLAEKSAVKEKSMSEARNKRQLTGRVVSDKMNEDGDRAGRAAHHASALRQGHDPLRQVPRARREQRVQGRATW